MAQSKDNFSGGQPHTRLDEDTSIRVAHKADTPLEGGKIAESEPVDFYSSAHNIEKAKAQGADDTPSAQPQMNRDDNEADQGGARNNPNTTSRRLPKKSVMPGPAAPAP